MSEKIPKSRPVILLVPVTAVTRVICDYFGFNLNLYIAICVLCTNPMSENINPAEGRPEPALVILLVPDYLDPSLPGT